MAALAGSVGCSCTDNKELENFIPQISRRGEFELPTAGDVEWLLFSYT